MGAGEREDDTTQAWAELIADAAPTVAPPIVAEEFVEGLTSASMPQKFRCDDGALYAVKFRENPYGNGRAIFTEQIVGLFGALIQAPVAEVRLVTVTQELLDKLAIDLRGRTPAAGVHHGSRWAGGFGDRMGISHADENREQHAALRVLYSWIHCHGDHQFIYSNARPHSVLSVDHSAFLPQGNDWSANLLRQHEDKVELDKFFDSLGLKDDDAQDTLSHLQKIQPHELARVIATPPQEWGISTDDRVALAQYAEARRKGLLERFGLEAT